MWIHQSLVFFIMLLSKLFYYILYVFTITNIILCIQVCVCIFVMYVFEFNFSRQQDQLHLLHLECTSPDLVGCFVIEIILEFH